MIEPSIYIQSTISCFANVILSPSATLRTDRGVLLISPLNVSCVCVNGSIQKYSTFVPSRTATLTVNLPVPGGGFWASVRNSGSVERALLIAAAMVGSSAATLVTSSRTAFSRIVRSVGALLSHCAAVAASSMARAADVTFDVIWAPFGSRAGTVFDMSCRIDHRIVQDAKHAKDVWP